MGAHPSVCISLVSPHTLGSIVIYDVVRACCPSSNWTTATLREFRGSRSTGAGGQCVVDAQVVGLPTVLFLVFLGWNLRTSLRKLQRSQSHIMTTYYVFLWVVSVLNIVRCFVQMAEVEERSPVLWNVLWLMTRFGAYWHDSMLKAASSLPVAVHGASCRLQALEP